MIADASNQSNHCDIVIFPPLILTPVTSRIVQVIRIDVRPYHLASRESHRTKFCMVLWYGKRNRCEGKYLYLTWYSIAILDFLGCSAVLLLDSSGVEISFCHSWCSKSMKVAEEGLQIMPSETCIHSHRSFIMARKVSKVRAQCVWGNSLPERSPVHQRTSRLWTSILEADIYEEENSFAKISWTKLLSGRSAARSQTSTLTVDFCELRFR